MARPPIAIFGLHFLLFPLLLLSLLTIISFFIRNDVNIFLLWSECHSHERSPLFKQYIPVLGTPTCFLISFFQEALDSLRSAAIMAAVLSLFAGLATVTTVESARICNFAPTTSSRIIRNPEWPWLAFNLLGGSLVWQWLTVPAFLHRAKQIVSFSSHAGAGTTGRAEPEAEAGAPENGTDSGDRNLKSRHLTSTAELLAVSLGVALGFVVPAALMLVFNTPVIVFVWLFFPIYISLIRQAVRWAILYTGPKIGIHASKMPLYLESHTPYLIVVYAVPILCSAAAHGFLIFNLVTGADDRRELTRSTLKAIQIDIIFLYLTVLYWILVEAGVLVALTTILLSMILGPGAGVCLAWAYFREHAIISAMARQQQQQQRAQHSDTNTDHDRSISPPSYEAIGQSSPNAHDAEAEAPAEAVSGQVGRRDTDPSERTPLLQ